MSLLQTDATKGLFAHAIVESGNSLSGWQRPDISAELSKMYLNISNCKDIQCLKNIRNTTQLIEYQETLFSKAQDIFPPGQVNWIEPFRPVIDNDLLKEDQLTALKNGHFHKVPTLVSKCPGDLSNI
jgi:carboxylesterase type B